MATRTRRESSATLAAKKKALQERIYCKCNQGYLSLFLGEELRMIKVFGHLCSRNHQLGSLFAVGAPETKNNKEIFILGAPKQCQG